MLRKKSEKTKEKSAPETEKKVEHISKKLSQEEFEKEVLELADKGMTSEKIGEHLRKQGARPKEYSRKISIILKEKNKYIQPDVANLSRKLEQIKKHYEKNKQDKKAMREKDRIFSNLRTLRRHHNIA